MSYEASLTTELLSRNLFSVVSESVLLLFINIVAIVGNFFVILAICRNTALRKITNWYILSLSISDLFVSVTCIPLSLVVIMKGKWLYGDVTCQFQGHVMQIWGCFSLTIVAATAFNRYYRILHPVRYRNMFTKRFAIITAVSSLFLSALASVGITFIIGARFQFGPHTFCTPDFSDQKTKKTVALPIFMTFIIASLTIVIFCYFKVYRAVRRHVILVAPTLRTQIQSRHRAGNNYSSRIEEINSTKMVFVVVLVFCLIWLPLSIIAALYVCNVFLPFWTHLMYDYLFCSIAATNPLIYGLMNKAFRNEYLQIIRCRKPSWVRMTTSRIIDATCGNVTELKYPQKLKHTKGITWTARRIVITLFNL